MTSRMAVVAVAPLHVAGQLSLVKPLELKALTVTSGDHGQTDTCCFVQADSVKEAQLRGPIAFPQERLLSYFWNLLKSEAADEEAATWDERAAQQQQSAEVFMLLRSLVSLGLLSQVLPCTLSSGDTCMQTA